MERIESPRTDDSAIEQEILRKGLTAPRVTPADIEAEIESEHYFTAGQAMYPDAPADQRGPFGEPARPTGPLDLLTYCVLVLKNGFTVTGESAVASPENFDPEVGRKVARQNAVNKVWPLLGYALKEKLHATAAMVASLPPTPDGMAAYTGTKQLFAKPMTRGDYNEYRGWAAPESEDQRTEGYLVEYADGGAANDSRHAGYISWSPADVFERAYHRIA